MVLIPFLNIGVMRPNFNSSGKYPCVTHMLKIVERILLIVSLVSSSTAAEIENTEPEVFRELIAISTSLLTIGTIKKEFRFLFFKYDVAFLSAGAISATSSVVMFVKCSIQLFGTVSK